MKIVYWQERYLKREPRSEVTHMYHVPCPIPETVEQEIYISETSFTPCIFYTLFIQHRRHRNSRSER